jgi:hypothetical protein
MSVETPAGPPSSDIQAASAAALGAAALKAQVLALREEREMEKLVLKVIELQIQKIQLKMANFANMEKLLDEEQKKVWGRRRRASPGFTDRKYNRRRRVKTYCCLDRGCKATIGNRQAEV